MIPRLNITFPRVPLPEKPIKWEGADPKFLPDDEFTKDPERVVWKFIDDEPDPMRRKTIGYMLKICRIASCPYEYMSRRVRRLIDPGIPCTNAFCKIYELCWETEVGPFLKAMAEKGEKIEVCCEAEAPGTFPIALLYYIMYVCPTYDAAKLYSYRGTTLPLNEEDERGLTDQYSLIALNKHLWFFGDHTLPADTRRMGKELGEGKYSLVTGDIGKPRHFTNSSEYEMFKEEYGQLIGSFMLLRDGGVACLKMFRFRYSCVHSMIRVSMGLFDRVRICKPRTSHTSGAECYWVLSGFHRDDWLKIKDDLIEIQQKALDLDASAPKDPQGNMIAPAYGSFIDLEKDAEEMRRIDLRANLNDRTTTIRRAIASREAVKCVTSALDRNIPPVDLKRMYEKMMVPLESDYLDGWIAKYPIRPIGSVVNSVTRIPKSS